MDLLPVVQTEPESETCYVICLNELLPVPESFKIIPEDDFNCLPYPKVCNILFNMADEENMHSSLKLRVSFKNAAGF